MNRPRLNAESITNINSEPLIDSIKSYFDSSEGPLYIMVPFISNDVLMRLLESKMDTEVCIVTSWRADHLKSGVSSLDLYPLCRKNGWTLYVNSKLHCKIYSDSFNSCIITSANCTNRALTMYDGNIECLAFVNELDVGNRIELNRIISESILVEDRVYKQYVSWYQGLKIEPNEITDDPKITDITKFYVFQLPAMDNPNIMWDYLINPDEYYDEADRIEHDLAIYSSNPYRYDDKEEFMDDIRYNFLTHPFIKTLEKEITYDGIRFGAFRRLILNNCSNVPLPFRKDINELSRNLYGWFVYLFPD